MNTSKDNFERQIRKQIEEREITPSRDLWSEIELQSESNTATRSKINWFLVAACIVLSFSLGTVLFLLKAPSSPQPELVKEIQKHDVEPVIVIPEQEHNQLAEKNNTTKNLKNSIPKETEEIAVLPIMKDRETGAKEVISEKKIEMLRIQTPKILAKADSSQVQMKKKKYVDPSTLLFSVEHKDVIEKTKDGSNVASIELNTK
ncbi:hypothetical protein PYS58_14835 [Chryseobacterium indologenes]|uniref:hypothetical protein n=1 Tax=Chryseobacterium indologenes TaxID=253 RepID=UPI0023E7E8B0|nr:hypothetical protein [Chryseobacterium indologenes]WET47852.1 hypothetical protein PYS58_14835 [Chryseobacterium indologenes]